MNEFSVRLKTADSVAGKLEGLSQRLNACAGEVDRVRGSLSLESRARGGLERSLKAVVGNVSSASEKAVRLSSALKTASSLYKKTENEILGEHSSDRVNNGNRALSSEWISRFSEWFGRVWPVFLPNIGGVTGLILAATCGGKTEESLSIFGWKTKKGVSANYKPGNVYLEGKISAEGSLLKYKKKRSKGLLSASSEVSALTGGVSAKGTFSLFKDGKFKPSIGAGVGAEVKGINGKTGVEFGNDDFDVHADAEGTVGYAKAEAGLDFDVRKGKFGGKAEVGAAVFKGEATGGFKLFGHKVDISVEGEALSVGAKAEFGADKDSVYIGGKLAAFLGLGFKIKISK